MIETEGSKYIAYALKRDGRVSRWVEIGVGNPHADGQGFDVVLDRLPVGGFNGHISVRDAHAKQLPPESPSPTRPPE